MLSSAVLTAAPLEVLPRPLLAIELVARFSEEDGAPVEVVLVEAVATLETVPGEVCATTDPGTALVVDVSLGEPPYVLTNRSSSVAGLCQYRGATSMTT